MLVCSWWQHAANLAGYKQQDAHEFFISAIDGFHANLANAVGPGKRKRYFSGNLRIICLFPSALKLELRGWFH